jgi:hypothetical protein
MTLQWIPLDALEPHPENSNRMPPRLLEKLKRHIQRTGLYEPLVVRPVQCGTQNAECGANRNGTDGRAAVFSTSPAEADLRHSELRTPHWRYQILNGHHRARVLRELGHTHARCDVWEVGDDDARLLLATLNRLEGRDDPSARARLVARLAESRPAGELAHLLPEPADAVERLLRLAEPPPAPLAPESLAPLARPMTFFLSEEQHNLVSEALRACGPRTDGGGDAKQNGGPQADPQPARGGESSAPRAPRWSRADALERLALWYLESCNLR